MSAPKALRFPAVPNRPLTQRDEADTYGDIALRHYTALDFIENAAFDAELVVYDAAYQNSQAHSPAFWAHMQDVAALLRRHFPRGS
ncbi:MAG: methyltransferase, partial [Holosporales bacterium]